jgi:hypothetical protein
MASRIESDSPSKASRRAAEPQATPSVRRKSAAQVPPPKPASKPAAPPAPEQASEEPAEDQEIQPAGRGFLKETPAWAISMLVHIVVLLAMALMTGQSVQIEKPTTITSSTSEEEEEISEFEEPTESPVEAPALADPVADVMVTTTEVVVTPITVAAVADDMEPAPLTVELTEFGSETALASDMMSTIGAVGGKGGGLGGRANPGKQAARGGGGGDTEAAVDRALKWFAEHQMPNGSWNLDMKQCPSCNGQCSHSGSGDPSNVSGATALALLPFLARGNTHLEGPYKKQVEQGIGFLVKRAIEGKGRIPLAGDPSNANYYVQGLAGMALSECYAMSKDDTLAAPTQAVLNVIMEAQDPVGGGWKYGAKQPGDMSVTSWQIMALKSGNMAYLQVNPLTVKKAVEFLDSVGTDDGAFYGYDEPGPIPAMTAAALLCRMYMGWKQDHPGLRRGAEMIARDGPSTNLYYNYYATQVMYQMGGDMWLSWNNRMKPLLLATQSNKGHEAGSWYEGLSGGQHHGGGTAGPRIEGYAGTKEGKGGVEFPKADSSTAGYGGRLYTTSLATMILEVYYRHLPIFGQQSTAEGFRD